MDIHSWTLFIFSQPLSPPLFPQPNPFRLIHCELGFLSWNLRLNTFVWELSSVNVCLGIFVLACSLGSFRMGMFHWKGEFLFGESDRQAWGNRQARLPNTCLEHIKQKPFQANLAGEQKYVAVLVKVRHMFKNLIGACERRSVDVELHTTLSPISIRAQHKQKPASLQRTTMRKEQPQYLLFVINCSLRWLAQQYFQATCDFRFQADPKPCHCSAIAK